MLPVGYLMVEHRLIDRMIALMKKELERIKRDRKSDPVFVGQAIDFIRVYADRGHHGKEEDILFRDLSSKDLSVEHKEMMQGLIDDHAFGRRTVKKLDEANKKYMLGDKDALGEIEKFLNDLVAMYPMHVEKEDKHFFLPVMAYLNQAEQDAMLEAFKEFDRKLIHEKYKGIVEGIEQEGMS
jgi:hemerythrin-like domain-containing protein